MNELGTYLRAAADDPPPTSIDLDVLIVGERRRTRILRVGAAFGGLAAAVAAVTLAVALLPGTSSSSAAGPQGDLPSAGLAGTSDEAPVPCGVVSAAGTATTAPPSAARVRADPTEPVGVAAHRLSDAVLGELPTFLPVGAKAVDFLHDRCESLLFVYDSGQGAYMLGVDFVDSTRGVSSLMIRITPAPAQQQPCAMIPAKGCVVVTANGSTVGVVTQTDLATQVGLRDVAAVAIRPDGTMVTARAFTNGAKPGTLSEPPLTGDQLSRLATLPDLTLYP